MPTLGVRLSLLSCAQGVAVQPMGDTGVLIAATDTVRGFSALDQAWLSAIADKVDATLEDSAQAASDPQPVSMAVGDRPG